jgi:hypothetical protein
VFGAVRGEGTKWRIANARQDCIGARYIGYRELEARGFGIASGEVAIGRSHDS